jgi:FKBP-type peptidyl-prolyl cis-trans isomerase FkpA
MNRIKFLLLTIVSSTLFFSCKKDDDNTTITPPRDRATQYATDINDIEDYLKTHYLTVTNDANGNPVPTIDSIPDNGQLSIWDQQDYPLQSKTVKNDTRSYLTSAVGTLIDDPVDYKIYYLKIREGVGESPTKVDSTFVTYNGHELNDEQFDNRPNPVWIVMDQLGVTGWRHILPEFKTGNYAEEPSSGNVTFTDYGVAVMFIPSGLSYYNSPPSGSGISAYSPLVFTVNLHALQYRDNDLDGILSKDEDLNGNGDYYDDDTDGDGIPNFIDIDDDGDGTNTLVEISDAFGNKYPFELIPNCQGTTGGLKKHLDPSCR